MTIDWTQPLEHVDSTPVFATEVRPGFYDVRRADGKWFSPNQRAFGRNPVPALFCNASGRVHTSYSLVGAQTGRLSSTDPNLQNIPIRTELGRQIRDAFVAEPGNVILAADYSQIELRLAAHMADVTHPVVVRNRPSKKAYSPKAFGWANWYINRGRLPLEPTRRQLRALSWRRVF